VRDLLLIGAGGFARETAEAVRAINRAAPAWNLLGFLDDDPARHGTRVGGTPVVGPIDAVADHPGAAIVICTGRPSNYLSRPRIAARLGLGPERYATLVHPTAAVGQTCSVGPGSVLLAQVVLTADVTIGAHVAVMPQVVLTHDACLADFCTVGSGVRVGGGCTVGTGAYVGAGAHLRENLAIGARAMIGMSAVVTRDVGPERLVYGAPAADRGPAPLPA
jgi:sugar O-acyltransferase (sialic acid O-acetyltransferase NeuD family)